MKNKRNDWGSVKLISYFSVNRLIPNDSFGSLVIIEDTYFFNQILA